MTTLEQKESLVVTYYQLIDVRIFFRKFCDAELIKQFNKDVQSPQNNWIGSITSLSSWVRSLLPLGN